MLTKYPRTYHLPWSKGITNDDKVMTDVSHLNGREVVVTEKMDGENTSLYYNKHVHARSLDSGAHESRDWVKAFWAKRYYMLGEGMRVCGENLYAKHSIYYKNLRSYFYGFSVWKGETCGSWDETMAWFHALDIEPVRVLYRGEFTGMHFDVTDDMEGYVVRLADEFRFDNFDKCVAKFVRKNHVQTDKHWMHSKIVKNDLTVS